MRSTREFFVLLIVLASSTAMSTEVHAQGATRPRIEFGADGATVRILPRRSESWIPCTALVDVDFIPRGPLEHLYRCRAEGTPEADPSTFIVTTASRLVFHAIGGEARVYDRLAANPGDGVQEVWVTHPGNEYFECWVWKSRRAQSACPTSIPWEEWPPFLSQTLRYIEGSEDAVVERCVESDTMRVTCVCWAWRTERRRFRWVNLERCPR